MEVLSHEMISSVRGMCRCYTQLSKRRKTATTQLTSFACTRSRLIWFPTLEVSDGEIHPDDTLHSEAFMDRFVIIVFLYDPTLFVRLRRLERRELEFNLLCVDRLLTDGSA